MLDLHSPLMTGVIVVAGLLAVAVPCIVGYLSSKEQDAARHDKEREESWAFAIK